MNPFLKFGSYAEDIVKRFLLIGCLAAIMGPAWAWADLNSGLGAMERSDYATAIKELTPLAEQGNAEAQFNLGKIYSYGWGVRKSETEAAKWYRKAAEQGDARAQKILAYMYANGVGVEKNPAEAEKWNQLASRPRDTPQANPVKQTKPAKPVPPPAAEDGRLWETHARQCKESLAKGDYALATEACQASLEEAERFGRHDRRLGISSWMLAALYHTQGKYVEAEPLYRRSLEIMEKTLGPNHPDVASILNNLAELYTAQGRYADAEPLYRRSLEIRGHGAKGRATAKSPGAVPKQTADINPSGNGNPTTILAADAQGHFITMGSINGVAVRMLVDTGATWVSMSTDEAWRIGLPYLNGKRVRVSTANGVVTGYRVMLDTIEVGNITLNQVEGVVREGSIGVAQESIVLLGMSFLNRVEMKREGAELTLIKK